MEVIEPILLMMLAFMACSLIRFDLSDTTYLSLNAWTVAWCAWFRPPSPGFGMMYVPGPQYGNGLEDTHSH